MSFMKENERCFHPIITCIPLNCDFDKFRAQIRSRNGNWVGLIITPASYCYAKQKISLTCKHAFRLPFPHGGPHSQPCIDYRSLCLQGACKTLGPALLGLLPEFPAVFSKTNFLWGFGNELK